MKSLLDYYRSKEIMNLLLKVIDFAIEDDCTDSEDEIQYEFTKN